jgi:hypothetical protein
VTVSSLRKDELKAQIQAAFSRVEPPGDWCLRGSDEGDEPFEVEEAFKGRHDWRALTPAFMNQPALSHALTFLSEEAMHYFLPAYLIADLDGLLREVNLVFFLTHGLDDRSRNQRINPRRYGERTWFDQLRYTFSIFGREEVLAIMAYLEFRHDRKDCPDPERIDQALRNYWQARAEELSK